MTFRLDRLVVCGLGIAALTANLGAATFTIGDVFASKSGSVREYSPTGTFVQSLSSAATTSFNTGSTFDSSGKFYVTTFGNSSVATFADNAANTSGTFGAGYSTPEDILIDSTGKTFVGNLNGPGLLQFNSAGVLQTSFAAGHRIDWFDLNSSETTMYYTDESGTIHTWNLTTNTAGADLCTNCGDFALRLLGDGTLLVAADNGGVNRINATTGAIVHNYSAASIGASGEFFALNLDPDGTTFWTGSFANDDIFRVNISTGAVITSFNSGTAGGSLYGLSVFGERTQVNPPPGVPEPASVILMGTMLSLVGFSLKRKLRAR
jgi:hypothetical protein